MIYPTEAYYMMQPQQEDLFLRTRQEQIHAAVHARLHALEPLRAECAVVGHIPTIDFSPSQEDPLGQRGVPTNICWYCGAKIDG